MIGICLECGAWHLMDRTPDADDVVLLMLPDPQQMRGV